MGCSRPTGAKVSGECSMVVHWSRTMRACLNRGQSRTRVSYSPPSPHTLHWYILQQQQAYIAGAATCRINTSCNRKHTLQQHDYLTTTQPVAVTKDCKSGIRSDVQAQLLLRMAAEHASMKHLRYKTTVHCRCCKTLVESCQPISQPLVQCMTTQRCSQVDRTDGRQQGQEPTWQQNIEVLWRDLVHIMQCFAQVLYTVHIPLSAAACKGQGRVAYHEQGHTNRCPCLH